MIKFLFSILVVTTLASVQALAEHNNLTRTVEVQTAGRVLNQVGPNGDPVFAQIDGRLSVSFADPLIAPEAEVTLVLQDRGRSHENGELCFDYGEDLVRVTMQRDENGRWVAEHTQILHRLASPKTLGGFSFVFEIQPPHADKAVTVFCDEEEKRPYSSGYGEWEDFPETTMPELSVSEVHCDRSDSIVVYPICSEHYFWIDPDLLEDSETD